MNFSCPDPFIHIDFIILKAPEEKQKVRHFLRKKKAIPATGREGP
jgi:hypothetical protein